MRIAVYSIVRDRLDLTRKSFKALRQMAGIDFDFYVADNGSSKVVKSYLRHEKAAGHIHYLQLFDENVGQNIAANHLLDQMEGYDWVLRWDNDAMPRTRRFLKKLVRAGERLRASGAVCVLSPRISRLKHPPEKMAAGNDIGFEYEVVNILGGICRLHPAAVFDEWRFSQFAPLGFGEATEMAQLCDGAEIPMLRIPHLEVEHLHGEDGQIDMMPDEFTWERREVGRHVSYGL